MATTASKAARRSGPEHELPLTRGARVGLLALLILTIAFASGVLFVKYQLEAFRADVARRIEERYGAHLAMGAISVNGFRGLRIENLRLDLPIEQGPILHIHTADARINIQLNDLIYGHVTVERVALDGANIVLERPKDGVWYSARELDLNEVVPFEVTQSSPFRITGAHCSFEIQNIVGATSLDVSDVGFDISRLVDASNLTASFSGLLSSDPRKKVSATLTMASLEDFDLRLTTNLITARDINTVLPADRPLVVEGAAHPTLWVNGRPGHTLFVSLEAPFENVAVRDQPDFLEPASGVFAVSGTYSTDLRQLSLMTAKADSNQLAGNVEGTITFDKDEPHFDLTMHAHRIPLLEILKYSLKGEMEDIGKMDILLDEPHDLAVRLTGTPQDPVVRGQTRAGAGRFNFTPIDKDLPPIQLALRQIEGAWDSSTQEVGLEFDVADGAIVYEPLRLKANGLQGHVKFKDNKVQITPMNAQYKGNAIVGEGEYDLKTGDGHVSFQGTVDRLDDTILADKLGNASLAGAVSIKGDAAKKGKGLIVDADLDATQADISFDWWFKKAAGLGTKGHVHAEIVPDSKATLTLDHGEVGASTLSATMALSRDKKSEAGWVVDLIHATSDHLDVNTAATCGITPYRTTGGVGTRAYFDFARDRKDPQIFTQRFGALIDTVSIMPQVEGATVPIVGKNVDVAFVMTTDKARRSMAKGDVIIKVQDVSVPPFGDKFLLPMEPPPGWPKVEREWSIDMKANAVKYPPWDGTNLVAHAYATPIGAGFSSYQAKIGDGVLKGVYDSTKADNVFVATSEWTDIPVTYLLTHLKLGDILEGTTTGKVRYTMDRDDPDTLKGDGHFEVTKGRFSADFLYKLIEGRTETNIKALPPNLTFSKLAADVDFKGDTVKTPVLTLDSDTIQVDGVGQYIRDGDMDYTLKVAVDPNTATQMPMMAEYFNLQGHKLSNTPIDLTFHVTGPTFKPIGRVEELPPASVALLSGGLEVGKEVANLVDFPRKVLMDLLKAGGGMVRGGRSRNAAERPPAP